METSSSNWWDEAYAAIQKTPVTPTQQNNDWGAMRDAFLISTAEKGLNYELTRALSAAATAEEKELMGLSADLDRRNTLDLMTAEQMFKLEGLEAANALSKDYLSAEGAQSRANIAAQGDVDMGVQQLRNTGAENVATTQAGASMYDADQRLEGVRAQAFAEQYVADQQRGAAETVATTQAGAARDVATTQADAQVNVATTQADASRDVAGTQASAARDVAAIQGGFSLEGIRAQQAGETQRTGMALDSAERQIGLTGDQARSTIRTQGDESRQTILTEAEQSRRNIAFEREHAAGLATRMSARG